MDRLPLRNTLSGKVRKHFDGLSIAQNDQATIGVAIAYLLDRAWVVTRLAYGNRVSRYY